MDAWIHCVVIYCLPIRSCLFQKLFLATRSEGTNFARDARREVSTRGTERKGKERKGTERNGNTCSNAAWIGDFGCLKYAHRRGCPWDANTFTQAVHSGCNACLNYMRAHGCPWDATATVAAIIEDDFGYLVLLHEQGCPWDERTCEAAAAKGDLESLKYLHENGCPWNANIWQAIVESDYCFASLACLKYVHENGVECDWRTIADDTDDDEIRVYAARKVMREKARQAASMIADEYDLVQCFDVEVFFDDHAEPNHAKSCALSRIRDTMATIDEVKENIPNGAYLKIANNMQHMYEYNKKYC